MAPGAFKQQQRSQQDVNDARDFSRHSLPQSLLFDAKARNGTGEAVSNLSMEKY